MTNAFAVFDTLYIIERTSKQCSGLSVNELSFLSYFGCLLSLYNGRPASEWGYDFLRNDLGAPVSAELFDSCDLLEMNGELIRERAVFRLTGRGENRLCFFMSLEEFKIRVEYLNAACDCLLMESILDILSTISKDAVISESSVHALKVLNSTDNSALTLLHQQFDVIKRAIGFRGNLFIPATSWLLFLRQNGGVA